MSDVDGVLAAIDGALTDYAVSGDAMRWTPEPEDASTRFEPARHRPWSELLASFRVVEDPAVPPGEVVLAVDVSRDEETLLAFRRVVTTEQREVHIAPRMSAAERERLIQMIARAYNVPVCLAAGHAWSAWEFVPILDGPGSYSRRCSREGCSGFEVQSAALWVPE